MRILITRYFPIYLINLFGILCVRKKALLQRVALYYPEITSFTQENLRMIIGEETINEERIHTEQMKWLLFIPYYVLYLVFFLVYLLCTLNFKRAYESNPFEREAKMNKGNLDYKTKYGWIKYL